MTRVIAHRGASRDRPENTIAAFDEALRQGCDGLELDVQLSRDEIPVVYHDRTLAFAGGGRRRVATLCWSELRGLGPTAPGIPARQLRLPSLEQVLERYAGRTRLLVEIKVREAERSPERQRLLARRVAEMVRATRRRDIEVLCFDPCLLDECAAAAPRVRRVLNLKAGPTLPRALRERLTRLHALSVDVRTLTPSFVRAFRRESIPLYVFTCNTPGRVARAVDAGATAIMSDRPGWLGARLARRASSASS